MTKKIQCCLLSAPVLFIAVLLIVFVPLVMLEHAHFPYSDGAEHCAAVRALAEDMVSPGDAMIASSRTDSMRYVPSIMLMALFKRSAGLDVHFVKKIALVSFFLLFAVSLMLFSCEYFSDSSQGVWSLAAALFLWGQGWLDANAYMFAAILFTSYYPSVVSFSLSLLGLYSLLVSLRLNKNIYLVFAMACGSIAFVNHPLTGCFFWISFLIVYVEKKGFSLAALQTWGLGLVVAVGCSILWPYYSILASLKQIVCGSVDTTLAHSLSWQYLHSSPVLRIGPALAGMLFLAFLIYKKRYVYLTFGFIVFLFLYSAGYYFHWTLSERFIFFVVLMMQLSFSRYLRLWIGLAGWRKATARLMVFIFCIGIFWQMYMTWTAFLVPSFVVDLRKMQISYQNPNAFHYSLEPFLGRGDVVLSDIYSSWSIPSYTGAKIVAPIILQSMQKIILHVSKRSVFFMIRIPTTPGDWS